MFGGDGSGCSCLVLTDAKGQEGDEGDGVSAQSPVEGARGGIVEVGHVVAWLGCSHWWVLKTVAGGGLSTETDNQGDISISREAHVLFKRTRFE